MFVRDRSADGVEIGPDGEIDDSRQGPSQFLSGQLSHRIGARIATLLLSSFSQHVDDRNDGNQLRPADDRVREPHIRPLRLGCEPAERDVGTDGAYEQQAEDEIEDDRRCRQRTAPIITSVRANRGRLRWVDKVSEPARPVKASSGSASVMKASGFT
jgi:hypothetical protein